MRPTSGGCNAAVIVLLVIFAANLAASPMGSAFSYQGRLTDRGNPANGIYDLQFTVFDASVGGSQLGGTFTSAATGVTNGLFTVTLDFGPGVFTGASRWLAIGVRTNAVGSFVPLSPLQPIMPTPYAIMANSASNLLGAVPAASLTGIVPLAQLPATVLTNHESGVNLSGSFAGNGAGLSNLPSAFQWQVVAGAAQQAQPNTGYVPTNAALVTITLPTAPAIGDIVRVTGAGVGGWKIAQNTNQTVLGVNLGLVGTTWTPRASSLNWRCVASSADGTKLVAGVDGGYIYTSTDSGVTWTPRAVTAQWYSVASSADGTKLVAAVNNGYIYTSTDSGATWTPRTISGQWYSTASSADGAKLVAAALNGQVYTSTDSGAHWTPSLGTAQWYSLASSADGTKLAAVATGLIYISTNSGANWTLRDNSGLPWHSVASSADGTKLVAGVNGGQIYTSTDSGVRWMPRDSSRLWYSAASSSDGTKLVAVVNGGQIYTSTDSGVTWTPRDSNRQWYSTASSGDGAKLVAVVYGGQIYTSGTATTTPGVSGYLLGGQNTAIELQYIGNNQFLPLSHEGAFLAY